MAVTFIAAEPLLKSISRMLASDPTIANPPARACKATALSLFAHGIALVCAPDAKSHSLMLLSPQSPASDLPSAVNAT